MEVGMGERMFKKIQYGLELNSAKGTEVDATSMFLGDAAVPSDRTYVFPSYNLAVAARSAEAHLYQTLVDGFTLNIENGYYQALPMLLSMATLGQGSPSGPITSGQNDYSWDFSPSMISSNVQDSFTFEIGDDVQAYLLKYVMAKKLTIAGAMGQNQAIKLSAECFAQSCAPTTFTSGLTIPIVEPMVANKTQFYIDTAFANVETTLMADLLRDFSLEIQTGLHPKFHGNSLTYDVHGEGYFDVMLRLTLEGTAEADALYDYYRSKTPLAIALYIEGSPIGTGHTHYLDLYIWGAFEEMQPMGSDADGNNLHTALFRGLYDPVSAKMLQIYAITNKSAV
jgi:hypothetical protein